MGPTLYVKQKFLKTHKFCLSWTETLLVANLWQNLLWKILWCSKRIKMVLSEFITHISLFSDHFIRISSPNSFSFTNITCGQETAVVSCWSRSHLYCNTFRHFCTHVCTKYQRFCQKIFHHSVLFGCTSHSLKWYCSRFGWCWKNIFQMWEVSTTKCVLWQTRNNQWQNKNWDFSWLSYVQSGELPGLLHLNMNQKFTFTNVLKDFQFTVRALQSLWQGNALWHICLWCFHCTGIFWFHHHKLHFSGSDKLSKLLGQNHRHWNCLQLWCRNQPVCILQNLWQKLWSVVATEWMSVVFCAWWHTELRGQWTHHSSLLCLWSEYCQLCTLAPDLPATRHQLVAWCEYMMTLHNVCFHSHLQWQEYNDIRTRIVCSVWNCGCTEQFCDQNKVMQTRILYAVENAVNNVVTCAFHFHSPTALAGPAVEAAL